MVRFFLLLCSLSGVLLAAPLGYHSFRAEGKSGGLFAFLSSGVQLDAWFFNSADFGVLVLDEGDGGERYGSLEKAMRTERCVAGINGGYFAADAASSPLGLVRHAGKQVAPRAVGSFAVSGLLYDTGSELCLQRSQALRRVYPAHMREAIQGGPFLVEHGRKVAGLNATRKARRSFVATDGKGNWCIAMSSPMTLDELAAWLVSGRALGSFRVQTALNMDGGTSSAFWAFSPPVYRPGVKPVRNYIGVAPRANSCQSGSTR